MFAWLHRVVKSDGMHKWGKRKRAQKEKEMEHLENRLETGEVIPPQGNATGKQTLSPVQSYHHWSPWSLSPQFWCIDSGLPSMHFHANKVAEIKEELNCEAFWHK